MRAVLLACASSLMVACGSSPEEPDPSPVKDGGRPDAIDASLAEDAADATPPRDAAARYAEMLASATPARPIKGTVLYCATGGATLAITSKVPQFFALAANDEVLGTAG